jgi:hypothetical protein
MSDVGKRAFVRGVLFAAATPLVACGVPTFSLGSGDDAATAGGNGGPVDAADESEGDAADESDGGDAETCASGGALGDGPLPMPEAGTCVNGWLTSDPGCPCDPSAFYAYCPAEGTRCFVPSVRSGAFDSDMECARYSDGALLWAQYPLYSPEEFAALPNEIDLDASDCLSRPQAECNCGSGEPTEGWLDTQVSSLTLCTYYNPATYFAFDDDGCVSQIRYKGKPGTSDFESCLQNALAGLRWACTSSGTHFVDRWVDPPLGGP